MNKLEKGKKATEKTLEKIGDMPISEMPTELIEQGKAATEVLIEKIGHFPMSTINAVTFKDELRDAFPVFNDELDTSFLLELLYYFPLDKIYIAAGTYDQYLYDIEKTIIDNYDAGNFQVSFFYAHLVFMSYVYYCVERVYSSLLERTRDVYYPMSAYRGQDEEGKKTGKPDLDNYRSVYDFSAIPEKDIFKLFHVVGMPDNTIKEIGKYINRRDNYAHATGNGNMSEDNLLRNIQSIRRFMEMLNELFMPAVKEQYIRYLMERLEVDYDSIADSAADFVFDSNLSIREIDALCNIGLRKVQDENGLSKEVYLKMRKEHCAFIEFCIENYGIDPPEGFSALRDDNYLFYRYKNDAKDYIENELGINEYRCVKDGGEFPLYECPECGEEQLAYNVEKGSFHCFACDESFTTDDISFCERCGSLMRRDTEFPVCSNCIEYLEKE